MTTAEVTFVKHMYGRERKRMVQALEDFDPAQFSLEVLYMIIYVCCLLKRSMENICVFLFYLTSIIATRITAQYPLQIPPFQT